VHRNGASGCPPTPDIVQRWARVRCRAKSDLPFNRCFGVAVRPLIGTIPEIVKGRRTRDGSSLRLMLGRGDYSDGIDMSRGRRITVSALPMPGEIDLGRLCDCNP
jgi:hypothetical protein